MQWQVRLDAVAAGYPGRVVMEQFTAHVPAFTTTAVVGPNGSGKSTLLGVVAGVIRATAGRVEHRTDRRVAYVAQRSAASDVLPMTVRDAVAMGRWERRGLWRRLSRRDRAVVEASMTRLGVDSLAHRQLGELSGGQRQRALVAQGLAQEADLLLLDEPATGLDATAQRLIADVLAEVTKEGVTVVQATHDLEAARAAGHLLLLRDGRLLAEGDPGALLTDDAIAEVWQLPRRV
ncbi:zinc ABC transporter ATP-binding protein AztA [Streptomyces sp. ID03-2B]|uniref:Zinc ABC transporter ATP-binding protein AztA n=2 Tax=Streptomyces TaxID=1883 RepID=A0AB33K522_9ACTN|nr:MULTISPECIES: zinc ABC transporter ATP-binding protein AztA [Streptomyces]WSV25498.1 zinc ABC transporter ATP-binding protein AztA [Streptomyces fimicarius]MCL6289081.1 metal ABC transporter ATP-binding protein [Streptomyces sp. 43Y-GA-1]MCX4713231.1 zinc ABC transporter ATP-binding protein AztA [Streptomyces griseus]MDX3506487.1 zinc ABC transporter ATP-binding protein AztA [Streptomyces sp. ATCC51928]MDX3589964.1 zinc ABC transporter ATP-binding protein AztA [Streptomyces sp. ID03-2B]